MIAAAIQFVLLGAVIVVAGTFLTRYGDAIAEITGLGRLLIGSVLIAGATSLPELTVDFSAVRLGLPDLAVGDLLGSSLANLLILAMLDLSSHSRGKMLSRAAAGHVLSGVLSIALTGMAGLGLLIAPRTPDAVFLDIHLFVWLVVLGYAMGVRTVFLDQRLAFRTASQQHPEIAERPRPSIGRTILGFGLSAAAIVAAGPRLADVAGELAEMSGLGGTFFGTTFVAFCTSLPEVVTCLAALRMGALDIAVGNVFGSNAFNMILLAPLDLAHPGSLLADVSPGHAITVFAVIIASTVAIMGQVYHVESRVKLLEPDAWLVIGVCLSALALVYFFA